MSRLINDHLAGGASRLAALLLPYILPVWSVVAPCHPGAALRDLVLVQARRATSRAIAVCLAAFAALVAAVGSVDASAFMVNPTQVMLSPEVPSSVLVIRNDSDTPLRFQLSMMKWGQEPGGQMQLTPTDDLVVFPLLLALKPKEERRIRIGIDRSKLSVAIEQTYRVFVEELPAAEAQANAGAIKVLTRIGVPIFIRPGQPQAAAAVESLGVTGNDINFRIANHGNVHVLPRRVTVRQLGPADAPIRDDALTSWYILAGGVREYTVPLQPSSCSNVRVIVAETQIGDTVLSKRFAVPPGICDR